MGSSEVETAKGFFFLLFKKKKKSMEGIDTVGNIFWPLTFTRPVSSFWGAGNSLLSSPIWSCLMLFDEIAINVVRPLWA